MNRRALIVSGAAAALGSVVPAAHSATVAPGGQVAWPRHRPWPAELKKVPRSHGETTREVVAYPTNERPGTIIISNAERTLHLVLGDGKAARYRISVGRDGFTWTGTTVVGRKVNWPEWRPPADMRRRDPSLPDFVPSGPYNPLGARALYLFSGGRDTLYRIHGTNSAETVGGYETSGCFRLSNADVMELAKIVPIGTKVIVK